MFAKASNAFTFSKVVEDHSKFEVENFECTPIDDFHDTTKLVFPSGTTGIPKIDRISHFFLLNYLFLPNDFNIAGILF